MEYVDLGFYRMCNNSCGCNFIKIKQKFVMQIERLEEERVTLKQDIRKLAQATGQRWVHL